MTSHRVIPRSITNLRHLWLEYLGGVGTVSVRNKEWLELLEEDTRNSLMIEGYFVSRAEVKDIIKNPKYTESADKVLGYFDAAVASYELAFQQYKTDEFKVTKSLIRQIHSMMFRGDPHFPYTPGEWRRGEMEITGARVKTSSPFEIERHVEKLIDIANTPTEDITRKVAVVHDMFEQIHPFPDGNGRVGRILLNFILVGHGYPNVAIKGSEVMRKKYIEALEEADPICAQVLRTKSNKQAFSKPLVCLEDLINRSLAVAMDVIICSRFDQRIERLLSLRDVAAAVNKPLKSIRVYCSQKKYICANLGKGVRTHMALLEAPPKSPLSQEEESRRATEKPL